MAAATIDADCYDGIHAIYTTDTEAERDMCLSCTRANCNNCIVQRRRSNWVDKPTKIKPMSRAEKCALIEAERMKLYKEKYLDKEIAQQD